MSRTNKLTKFQQEAQKLLKQGKNVLIVAPTGLGKTLAVTADLQEKFTKTIYAVPLRALGVGIRDAIAELKRNGNPIEPKVHHGDIQESLLFSEEVVVTTYDQVVCAVPGLPLSLPLKAGHAVAAALLMSRLILDEAHLAWGISRDALPILLGIMEFRRKLGLQTVVQTATLPMKVAELLKDRSLVDECIIVGKGDLAKDEGLLLRRENRLVAASLFPLKLEGKGEKKRLSFRELDNKLMKTSGKRIFFCNTVGRLQETYDRLITAGLTPDSITMLHNRMPRSWRERAEKSVVERFGKRSPAGNWLLLTNQVAEAGLDISAPLVISDPAPVDTLVQRAGRCARWFRKAETQGEFLVLVAPNEQERSKLGIPYRDELVKAALDLFPQKQLSWENECDWVDVAWGGDQKKALEAVSLALDQTTFALNLFDRAAQERRPGTIGRAFREILSVEIAVEDVAARRELQQLLDTRRYPETSSVSFGQAQALLRKAQPGMQIIRYEEGHLGILPGRESLQLGDVLVVPSTIAYLHEAKGLCFIDNGKVPEGPGVKKSSEWNVVDQRWEDQISREGGRPQSLFQHVKGIVDRTRQKLADGDRSYRKTLVKILGSLEGEPGAERLAELVTQIALVGAAFHDLGKGGRKWQEKARKINPSAPDGLIGRTGNTQTRIKLPPHTPPGFGATVKACELLLGELGSAEHLVRLIALAAARHHSCLTNPSMAECDFEPHSEAVGFVRAVLKEIDAPTTVIERAEEIVQAAVRKPSGDMVPLALPNDDLFPIYALIGRAILMADREDAAGGKELEQW